MEVQFYIIISIIWLFVKCHFDGTELQGVTSGECQQMKNMNCLSEFS